MLIPDLDFDLDADALEHCALMATNPTLEMVYWSPGAQRLLGFRREDVLGRLPFEVFMSPQDFAVAADYCSQLMNAAPGDVELQAHYSAHTDQGGRLPCDWYHQRVYSAESGALMLVLCLVVPATAGAGFDPAHQRTVEQFANTVQRWLEEREQRWQRWSQLFSERCSARRFEQGPYADLTPRERELVEELARSIGLKLAARNLGISLNTARNHLKSVFSKLQIHSQAQLIREVRSLATPQRGGY
ncbi:LuxR family transcriptional regulator [Parahaliea mediterranea]|uniref:LuxR family transcriptional regulator n=1 Tax=Parahaliea mediterranea TaxID=651086 RepID=UPI000E2FBACA|nr:LuxR C-terminal-related transcriptional regulator [Parahaliea mediterranea]